MRGENVEVSSDQIERLSMADLELTYCVGQGSPLDLWNCFSSELVLEDVLGVKAVALATAGTTSAT